MVSPLFSAIWKWIFSSSLARSAMSAPRVTRLRDRRSRPGRVHSAPKTWSRLSSPSSSATPPSLRLVTSSGIAGQHLLEHVQPLSAGVSHGVCLSLRFAGYLVVDVGVPVLDAAAQLVDDVRGEWARRSGCAGSRQRPARRPAPGASNSNCSPGVRSGAPPPNLGTAAAILVSTGPGHSRVTPIFLGRK